MAGYWIVRGNVKDKEAFEEYARLWGPIAERYGASYVAAGGRHETREGVELQRVAIVEFSSYEQAIACYDDPDYRATLPQAFKAYDDRELVIVEGR